MGKNQLSEGATSPHSQNTNTANNQSVSFSLLWPPGSLNNPDAARTYLSLDAIHDLDLDRLVLAFTPERDHRNEIMKLLTILCLDTRVIRYRQEIIADLRCQPRLVEEFTKLLPTVDALKRYSFESAKKMNTLHEITYRMGELQGIIDAFQGLGSIFEQAGDELTSQGLRNLRDETEKIRQNPDFQNLVQELPELLSRLRTCASVTIGVNLDQYLRPVEATLLSVHEKKFTSQSLFSQLFGTQGNEWEGIAQLHVVPKRIVDGPYGLPVDPELGRAVDPMLVPLFEDLAKVLEKTTQPIAKELKRYVDINSQLLVNLREELIFYLGALRFTKRMEAQGLPMCIPEITLPEERLCQVEDSYNVNLALRSGVEQADVNRHQTIVRNDIQIGPGGRVLILTGPNQGGKTTYMLGIALLQVLGQVGLYVPGRWARLSPVDNIYTHFPIEEKPQADTGRFGDEAKRLSTIFHQLTRNSLVLLNESLASTSAGESLYLAQDVVSILRRIGCRAIYSTHMHELAARVDEINASVPGESELISLVSSPVGAGPPSDGVVQRSYIIQQSPPAGRSYAREIAERYGIGYDQLEQMLVDRGILEHEKTSKK